YKDPEQLAEEEQEHLRNQTIHLMLDFRMVYIEQHLKDLMRQIAEAGQDPERMKALMVEYKDMQQVRNALAKQRGSHIIG
ncbi:MAG: DNA primase, partial [Prevotella sp.]